MSYLLFSKTIKWLSKPLFHNNNPIITKCFHSFAQFKTNSIRSILNCNTVINNNINHNMTHKKLIVRNMANHRHKKMIKLAKGYRGRANRCFTVALQRVTKARQYAYRDRKVKKREFRALWIQRINAASRMYGLPYSILINKLQKTDIIINRKVLADLAVTEPLSFKSIVEVAKLS